ncbi:GerMN domain-containing protein [Moorella sulfitireducens (nom. illeg.)]|uniref:GerMN domain-containing protein n=1 Tax=Neomoorella sulfitireducens TaxID=2972948 RepID=UPI0021AC7BCB|nr:GerMN domain-containing protein [Moorella sulfitireducens]
MRKLFLALLAILLVFVIPGCSGGKTAQLEKQVADLQAQLAETRQKLQASAERIATLYFIKETPSEFYLAPELRRIDASRFTAEKVLQELISGPKETTLKPVLPQTVKVLGVKTEKGLATVDFSQEIKSLNVGSRGEVLVLAAIANTLIKLPEIEKVQILVEGKKLESLAGHVDISEPLGRNETVLLLN